MLILPNCARTACPTCSPVPKETTSPARWKRIGTLFGAKLFLLEGAGGINGSFLKLKLIDEFSTLIHLAVDGVAGAQSIVDYHGPADDRPGAGQALRLTHCEALDGGMVWLRHTVERAGLRRPRS